ncbi:helix-turn-helix domain-containing protein [Kaistella flava (ex Peng et al. 2021)]|uniref:Helix-turn-helix domain-containing protein n=1 Tax=Kaistella flava (ex Peng et al. 2021) TaxID=2038776 RepID=A0A7M2YCL5_9FLAO|nr:helix-turn-helix domain-containing protein [Kaistella flava (ex Peng et al. 2021)]QOW11374.1 helix-turn-helix domain-containing protein [Kaistella flava (ex Peng et al. 2021)]
MEQINFVGIEPTALISEIVGKIKSELLADLTKTFNDNQPNRYYSAQDICERFGISKPTIHEWRKRGILKTYKLGSRVYYRMDDIEKAMIIND